MLNVQLYIIYLSSYPSNANNHQLSQCNLNSYVRETRYYIATAIDFVYKDNLKKHTLKSRKIKPTSWFHNTISTPLSRSESCFRKSEADAGFRAALACLAGSTAHMSPRVLLCEDRTIPPGSSIVYGVCENESFFSPGAPLDGLPELVDLYAVLGDVG